MSVSCFIIWGTLQLSESISRTCSAPSPTSIIRTRDASNMRTLYRLPWHRNGAMATSLLVVCIGYLDRSVVRITNVNWSTNQLYCSFSRTQTMLQFAETRKKPATLGYRVMLRTDATISNLAEVAWAQHKSLRPCSNAMSHSGADMGVSVM